MNLLDDYLQVCRSAAVRGGAILRQFAGPIGLRRKSARDLVTTADEQSERAILDVLAQAFPEHTLLSEEQSGRERCRPLGRFVWAIDPLDGTTNFVHGFPHWCVSIALLQDGLPAVASVYDPLHEEHFWAAAGEGSFLNGDRLTVAGHTVLNQALLACSFGPEVTAASDEIRQFLQLVSVAQAVRRTGSTALNLAYLAAGRIDACWTLHSHVWDVAAGALLVAEAGGCVASMDGQQWRPDVDPSICAAANAQLLAAMFTRWQGSE